MASAESPATNIPETNIGGARGRDECLPNKNVSRIMSKEAKNCVQEATSEFIAFLSHKANDRCLSEKRESITGDDVLWGIESLGFHHYVEPLRLHLQRHREGRKQMGVQPAAQLERKAGGSDAIHGGSENPGGQQGTSHPGDNIDLS